MSMSNGSGNSGQLVLRSTGAGYWVAGSTVTVTDGSGLMYSMQGEAQLGTNKSTRKRIGPKLFFSYVKTKLNKTQVKKLKGRLTKLQKLVNSALENGQNALYEELSKMLLVAVRESEASALGYDTFINQPDIDKYRYIVTESDSSNLNPVHFCKLEDFPRAIPTKISKVIKSVQAKGIFDELWVLYLDYSKEKIKSNKELWVLYLDYSKEKIKSNKEKIREKDPILFGRFNYDSNKNYFIADWVDEYCDLTLSKFIDTLKEEDPEYEAESVPEMTQAYLDQIKAEIKERADRLADTNRGNFRDLMKEEDKAELERLRKENSKLRDDESFRDEAREIAIEKAIAEERAWRGQMEAVADKKPWYKRIFG